MSRDIIYSNTKRDISMYECSIEERKQLILTLRDRISSCEDNMLYLSDMGSRLIRIYKKDLELNEKWLAQDLKTLKRSYVFMRKYFGEIYKEIK